MDIKRLARLRTLSDVPRWCVIRTIRRQNVAEHSFHVAAIALWLNQFLQIGIEENYLLKEALFHDEWESITGDTPSNFKHVVKKAIDYYEAAKKGHVNIKLRIIKLADIIEAMLFIEEEMRLGNKSLQPVFDELMVKGRLVQQDLMPTWDVELWDEMLEEKSPLDYLLSCKELREIVGMTQI